MSDSLEDYNQALLLERDIDLDNYRAYMAGVNVGMEAIESGRLDGMTGEEKLEWFVEMYESRVVEE